MSLYNKLHYFKLIILIGALNSCSEPEIPSHRIIENGGIFYEFGANQPFNGTSVKFNNSYLVSRVHIENGIIIKQETFYPSGKIHTSEVFSNVGTVSNVTIFDEMGNDITNPSWDYKLNSGQTGNLDDFLGKWLVVNYWADWCPPCIKEMPELENFYKQNNSKALVLAYNFDRLEGEELRDQIERFKVNVPSILTDPGLLFGWAAPPSLPATYIITPDGNLVETLIGPQTKDSLEEIISKHEKSL